MYRLIFCLVMGVLLFPHLIRAKQIISGEPVTPSIKLNLSNMQLQRIMNSRSSEIERIMKESER